jgi:hypothetical protein
MGTEIESQSRLLEDDDAALLASGETGNEAEIVGDDELATEFTSFDELAAPAAPAKPVTAKPAAAAAAPAAAASGEDDLPPEFKGKSVKDVVKMYQEAHSTIGRQGQELGEYRRKADQVIQASLRVLAAQKAGQQPAAADVAAAKPLEESEIFAKPIDSVNRLIENHPLIQEIRKTMGATAANETVRRAEAASERFKQAHPDAPEVLRDPEFRKWVSASPIRRDLLLRANNHYDFAAGDEVFSTWKALSGKTAAATTAATTAAAPAADGQPSAADVTAAAQTLARARAAKTAAATQQAAAQAAAAPTGGASAAPAKGAGKKIFRRADVIRLMVEDPDRYEQLSGELQVAYAEGRVR